MFCPRTAKLTEKRVKKHCWGFGWAGWQLGADGFIYARSLHEFDPPSKNGPESPGQGQRSGCKAKHRWGLGRAGSVSPSKSGPESVYF